MSFDLSGGAGAAVSVGSAAAQGGMNPIADISAAISLVGLGTSIFGGAQSSSATSSMSRVAQAEADANSRVSGLEQQINGQRHQQMVLDTSRQQLQIIRNTQLARSMAINSASGQGVSAMGSGSSGLMGGLGQISGDSGRNIEGINQNLQIGNNIFGFNDQISQQKQLLAQLGGQMAVLQGKSAQGQGIASIGGAVTKAADPLSKLMGGFGTDTSQPNNGSGIYTGDPSVPGFG